MEGKSASWTDGYNMLNLTRLINKDVQEGLDVEEERKKALLIMLFKSE